jgi:hypothetical protein
MSYQVLVGQRKALVFPVMCYGYLRVDYSDEVALTDYGLFNHSGPITIQAMVTPYDVNGFGYTLDLDNPIGKMGVTNSKKTMPAQQSKAFTLDNYSGAAQTISESTYSQSYKYLTPAAALTHEMMLFYNTNIQLSLLNATTTNMNQPAEYKIKFTINANGTSDTLTTTDTIINANDVIANYHVSHGFDTTGGGGRYLLLGAIATVPTSTTFTTSLTEDEVFNVGDKLYTQSGQTFTHIATVTGVTSTTVTVSLEAGQSLTASAVIFKEVDKEANYLVTPYHISASYDNTTGLMNIYLNGTRVASKFHSAEASPFTVEAEDCYIGVSTDNADANTRKQFMGELHELAVIKGNVNSFISTETLLPNYRNILLYYRFEEVDE